LVQSCSFGLSVPVRSHQHFAHPRQSLAQRGRRAAATGDVALIPLRIQKNLWAMRRGVVYATHADEQTRAWVARPAR
jgi:peptide/nickel transport system substrate-binding protein